MHEQGLLNAAVAALVEAAGPLPVHDVVLATGPGVDPEAARAAWAAAAAGSPAQEAVVSWRNAYDVLACFDCGREYPGGTGERCPDCAGDGLVVHPAPEITILDWRPARAR